MTNLSGDRSGSRSGNRSRRSSGNSRRRTPAAAACRPSAPTGMLARLALAAWCARSPGLHKRVGRLAC